MTDRELLELAARAAGMNLDYTIRPDGKAFYHSERNAFALADGGWFAPLTDDGDALRLAVKLGMRVYVYPGHGDDFTIAACDEVGLKLGKGAKEDHGNDPSAATRRAIVRAAASIGKGMK